MYEHLYGHLYATMNVRERAVSLWLTGILNEYWYTCVSLEAVCHSFISLLFFCPFKENIHYHCIRLCTYLHVKATIQTVVTRELRSSKEFPSSYKLLYFFRYHK